MHDYDPDILKLYEYICDADPRQKLLHSKLDVYYARISEITLNGSVPQKVRIHFETTRNLFLYSWFVYRFISVAQLHAYVSMEFALNEKAKRCGILPPKKRKYFGLNELLTKGIEYGWIKDEGFKTHREAKKRRDDHLTSIREMISESDLPEIAEIGRYCDIISTAIPSLRNALAHGSEYLEFPYNALSTLQLSADLINQLFPNE